MTTVVYLHGFASGPQGPSPKTDLIRKLGHEVALIATDSDYRPAGYRVWPSLGWVWTSRPHWC